jgi:hypothetical protein
MPATDPTSGPTHGTGHGNTPPESEPTHSSDTTDAHATHRQPRELATLVDDTDDTNRYTICPARADATELLTTWLTVDEPIVCDLDDWR